MAVSRVADALPLPLALPQAMPGPLPGDDVPALPLPDETGFLAVIHQAAGMISHQRDCDISDALALLRARAFSAGRRAEEVAADVVRGELRLG